MAAQKKATEEAVLIGDNNSPMTPLRARELVRENNYQLHTLPRVSYGKEHGRRTLEIPYRGVLLMIGNTSELKDAIRKVRKDSDFGFGQIVAEGGAELKIYFARINVSRIQTDTLLAITTATNWDTNGEKSWRKVPVESASLLHTDDPEDDYRSGKSRSIINVFDYCKSQADTGKGWISSY